MFIKKGKGQAFSFAWMNHITVHYMAFCYYMKCCSSFKSTATAGLRTMEIAMMRAHTAGHWHHLFSHL